jgi:hypothetical protein
MGIPISERLAAAKYNRQAKRKHRQGNRESNKLERQGNRRDKWQGNHPGKFVSSQYTHEDVGKKYAPGSQDEQKVEHHIGGDKTNTHTTTKSLTDGAGNVFDMGTDVTTNTTTTPDKTVVHDETSSVDHSYNNKMYDNNKKFMGDRVNEVYKINDVTPNEDGGKMLDKVRSSTISHKAQTYESNRGAGSNEVLSTTRIDAPKTMVQTKTKKSGVDKTKKFVARGQYGGTTDFDVNSLDPSGNPRVWQDDGVHSTSKTTKKEMKDQGYKVISDKRMERKHKRFGNYKENKTIISGKRAAQGIGNGATGSQGSMLGNKKDRQNTITNISNRLWQGKEKSIDINREKPSDRRKRKRKK